MDIITFFLCALIVEVILREFLERTGRMKGLKERFSGKIVPLIFLVAAALLCIQGVNMICNSMGVSTLVSSIIGGVILGPFLTMTLAFLT